MKLREWSKSGTLAALLVGMLALPATAEWVDLGGHASDVSVLESQAGRTVLEFRVGGFDSQPVMIDGTEYRRVSLDREGELTEIGMPELPVLRRSIIIPDDRRMNLRVLAAEYIDLPGFAVAPSRGTLLRTQDPATVPYSFDVFYDGDGIWPAEEALLGTPYILRDFRGVVVNARMFAYLPASETLRVYTTLRVEVAPGGAAEVNALKRRAALTKMDPQFAKLYGERFINYAPDRYDTVLEDGSLLIISYDAFIGGMQPFLQWKLQKGMNARLVGLSETGSSYSQIKSYIQNEYDTGDLGYVILVGDAAQVPTYGGDSDPAYSLLAGGDSYPEIFIGRFSAENVSQLATQVERSVEYERDVAAGLIWPQYGTGVASNQGPGHHGEYDDEHEDLIRQKLLDYGYLGVDQIYDPSGTAAMVSAALNEGRGIVNYTGHGSETSWGSTGFSNSNVNSLVNDNMLPFISSVACVNGSFTSTTCFAEAWLRATHNGEPSGAIACYMSKINQSWSPPMDSQDEAIDLLVADEMRTVGGLWFNGSCLMIDLNGSTGESEFKNWTIFGDPSLAVRTKAAQVMNVTHAGVMFLGLDQYEVNVPGVAGALCALYADGVLYGSAVANAAGQAVISMASPPDEVMTLTLTVTAYNKVTVAEDVQVLPPGGAYLVFSDCEIDDADGDGDGALDEGEQAGLSLTLENMGTENATGVSATLVCTDPYVTVLVAAQGYPDIPAGSFGVSAEPFEVSVAGDIPDGHLIQFDLAMTSDQGDWEGSFYQTAQAPSLTAAGLSVDDFGGGNGDGGADPGETVLMQVLLGNAGASAAEDVGGVITCSDANIIILDDYGECDFVQVGANDALLGSFQVQVLEGCPTPGNIPFDLEVEASNGYAVSLSFDLAVGGWFDDMEVDRGWTVGAAGDDANTGIWERVDPNGTTYEGNAVQPEDDHTPAPGTHCYVTGNGSVGGSAGENDVDNGRTTLLSPLFNLEGAESATVSYWRWYTNDTGYNPDEDWWDVAVSDDGANWVTLEHTQSSAAAWTQFSFDLGDYIDFTAQVQLRFVASDEGAGGSLVEAAVDDFYLDVVYQPVTGVDDDGGVPASGLSLAANHPNPFNPSTKISFTLPAAGEVQLAIFDVHGRLVRTLVSGTLEGGAHELFWNGNDDSGHGAASGVYFSRLRAEGKVLSRKMILMK